VTQLTIAELLRIFPYSGELVWIGLRPARKEPMISVNQVMADRNSGLTGDRFKGRSGERQVTLIQWEHLAVLDSITGRAISAELLRRNLAIKGINLLALKNRTFRIGEACFLGTGLCHPCSRMETVLGAGGYNAMRGHGGITARIISSGLIRIGDRLTVIPDGVSLDKS
jgi:MOSC domain-containing protein YiiM